MERPGKGERDRERERKETEERELLDVLRGIHGLVNIVRSYLCNFQGLKAWQVHSGRFETAALDLFGDRLLVTNDHGEAWSFDLCTRGFQALDGYTRRHLDSIHLDACNFITKAMGQTFTIEPPLEKEKEKEACVMIRFRSSLGKAMLRIDSRRVLVEARNAWAIMDWRDNQFRKLAVVPFPQPRPWNTQWVRLNAREMVLLTSSKLGKWKARIYEVENATLVQDTVEFQCATAQFTTFLAVGQEGRTRTLLCGEDLGKHKKGALGDLWYIELNSGASVRLLGQPSSSSSSLIFGTGSTRAYGILPLGPLYLLWDVLNVHGADEIQVRDGKTLRAVYNPNAKLGAETLRIDPDGDLVVTSAPRTFRLFVWQATTVETLYVIPLTETLPVTKLIVTERQEVLTVTDNAIVCFH